MGTNALTIAATIFVVHSKKAAKKILEKDNKDKQG